MVKYIIQTNGTQWCYNCWKSVVDGVRIRFINKSVPYNGSRFLHWCCYNHYRLRCALFRLLPFTCIWYKSFDRTMAIDDNCDVVLIIYDWSFLSKDFNFLKYIRKHHPRLKIVYLFSNIVKVTGARLYGIVDNLNDWFDAVYAFDKEDAKHYCFDHSPLIYTAPVVLPDYSDKLEYDLFYIGEAKDRYNKLIEIYEKAKGEGLRCHFIITSVPEEIRKYEGEIEYNPISYNEVLDYMAKSKCIVDAIQGGSTALTIKTCESVVMGRKLLTTNSYVQNERFYNANNILVYDPKKSIKDFIEKPMIRYSDDDKYCFSPDNLFNKIEHKLYGRELASKTV